MVYFRFMNRQAIIVVIVLALLAGGGYVLLMKMEKQPVFAPPANIADAIDIARPIKEYPLIVTEHIKRLEPTQRYSIDVEYPVIVLAIDQRTAQIASDVIKGEVNRSIEGFIENALEMANAENIPPEITSDLTIRYTPILLTPSLIAVRFDHSAFIRGAAHPDSGANIVVYDLTNHSLLSTADLFSPGSDYLGFLSDYTRDRLRANFSEMSNEEFAMTAVLGTAPKAENFREVLPTKNGLTVIFNPYQVAPYARGIVTIDIPLADVESKLSSVTKNAIREANASTTPGVTEPSILMRD